MDITDFLDETKTAIVLVDTNFKIKYVNSYTQKLLSLTHGNLFNKNILDFHSPDAREKIKLMFKTGFPHADEYPIIQIWEGSNYSFLLWAKLSCLYDKNGKLAFIIATIYDLTKQTLHREKIGHEKAITRLDKIPIFENRKIKLLNVNSICYIKSSGNYSTIFREDGKCFLTTIHLNFLEEKLPASLFMRVHRSFIVNLEQVEEIILEDNEKYLLKLHSNCQKDKIYISRRKYNTFRSRFMI